MFNKSHGFFYLPTLETDRLILRQITMRDASDIYAYSQDIEVARHVLWSAQRNISEAKDFCRYMIGRYKKDLPSSFGIIEKKSGHLIGTIGYMNYDFDNAIVEIGYSLARWCWNQGYMTEEMLTPDYIHWLYTAFTRATEQLFLVNWPKNQVEE